MISTNNNPFSKKFYVRFKDKNGTYFTITATGTCESSIVTHLKDELDIRGYIHVKELGD